MSMADGFTPLWHCASTGLASEVLAVLDTSLYRQCHLLTADGTRARPGDTVPYAIVTVHPVGTS